MRRQIAGLLVPAAGILLLVLSMPVGAQSFDGFVPGQQVREAVIGGLGGNGRRHDDHGGGGQKQVTKHRRSPSQDTRKTR